MKKHQILVALLLCFGFANAQEVISNQGDSYSNASGSIDFTIGEIVIATATDGSNDLTQGFHQTNWGFVGIEDHAPSFEATIYPNPTEEVLNIKTPFFENVQYTLYDAKGSIVLTNTLSSEVTEINVAHLVPGQYSVALFSTSKNQIKTFKLIKHL